MITMGKGRGIRIVEEGLLGGLRGERVCGPQEGMITKVKGRGIRIVEEGLLRGLQVRGFVSLRQG